MTNNDYKIETLMKGFYTGGSLPLSDYAKVEVRKSISEIMVMLEDVEEFSISIEDMVEFYLTLTISYNFDKSTSNESVDALIISVSQFVNSLIMSTCPERFARAFELGRGYSIKYSSVGIPVQFLLTDVQNSLFYNYGRVSDSHSYLRTRFNLYKQSTVK